MNVLGIKEKRGEGEERPQKNDMGRSNHIAKENMRQEKRVKGQLSR
jgi:hypothetical protein